jgi:hypothetical protein
MELHSESWCAFGWNCGPPCDAVLHATLWPLMTLYSTRQDAAHWQTIDRLGDGRDAEAPVPYSRLPKNADCRAAGGDKDNNDNNNNNNNKFAAYAADQARGPVRDNVRCQTSGSWPVLRAFHCIGCSAHETNTILLRPVVITIKENT